MLSKQRILNLFIPKIALISSLALLSSCATGNEIVQPKPDDSKITKSNVDCWLTSPSNSLYLKKQKDILNFSAVLNSNPSITVDSLTKYQTMDGFGFAMTGGSAFLINKLAATDKSNLVKELFSNDSTAIGTSYLRISLGASDLSSSVFSYDDIDPSKVDTTLQYFSIKPDSTDLIPVLKSVVAINPNIKILASPWSAPAWMKTNKSAKGGSLKQEFFGVYARYFVKYIQAMKAQGIAIDAITIQNEPLNPDNNPSMYMTAVDQALFVKNYLGPEFAKASITTKIILYDHNCDMYSYPLTVLNDPDARKYSDGSAFHLYGGNIVALTTVHNAYPDKNVYFTEQWVGAPGNFAEDLKWHVKNLIIGAPRNWSKNVIEWNLASDPNYYPHTDGGCGTCLGALTIGNNVSRNVAYYIIGHASKFVPMGSVRIESSVVTNLPNVAYLTPTGKKVLIVLNESNSTQTFNIQFNKKIVTHNLVAGAVATYVW
ncbi:MAG TPA: glycoside hydrolase family 30 beta sandwich domain-containing protein [Paludibacter sp.]|nr:glycoside hydrolase family 30 beta sandwich domain-containing protein [Paludibacter sp.]